MNDNLPKTEEKALNILTIGPCTAIEAMALNNLYGKDKIHFLGIETDDDLCKNSQALLKNFSNVEIIKKDKKEVLEHLESLKGLIIRIDFNLSFWLIHIIILKQMIFPGLLKRFTNYLLVRRQDF